MRFQYSDFSQQLRFLLRKFLIGKHTRAVQLRQQFNQRRYVLSIPGGRRRGRCGRFGMKRPAACKAGIVSGGVHSAAMRTGDFKAFARAVPRAAAGKTIVQRGRVARAADAFPACIALWLLFGVDWPVLTCWL